ncbi:hypothetical protein Sulac_0523 [Sulfobacillus acidophilus DSM 10332]|uniref:Uncharacterized protein n=1 Tax=Sulfobacillus acidophilus (strain ATCC 700253 / DSM 10332 / NAL) TaxID=679936 RepID=G8TZ95_SULAD|nr:hypothetical protein Sulac_0523 [Sulfobacillus acidophilus DSM 10332]
MDSWEEHFAALAANRTRHVWEIPVAGGGQPLEPMVWPLIEIFWALRIPTVGSCD